MSQLQFDLDHVIDTLASEGWVVIPHALSAAITANLRTACLDVWQQGLFHEAATGRADGQAPDRQAQGVFSYRPRRSPRLVPSMDAAKPWGIQAKSPGP